MEYRDLREWISKAEAMGELKSLTRMDNGI